MRILTHNMLACTVKECRVAGRDFPLTLRASELAIAERELNANFLLHILPRLEWPALKAAAAALDRPLPEQVPAQPEQDTEFLQQLHHVLQDIEVVTGELVCQGCGRVFPIKDGVPDMILNEDEVAQENTVVAGVGGVGPSTSATQAAEQGASEQMDTSEDA